MAGLLILTGWHLVVPAALALVAIAVTVIRKVRSVSAPDPAPGRRRVIDLSHVIRDGLITYPGLPAPMITPHLTREQSTARYAPGTEFAMDIITMIGNTGTYLDSPYHRYEGGTDLAGLDLAGLVELPAEVFHLRDVAPGGARPARSRPRSSTIAICAERPCCSTPAGAGFSALRATRRARRSSARRASTN